MASSEPGGPEAARRNLLAWYDRQKRDLPWRRSRDPYAIWVSEIMLQQTQVSTVLPYYAKFLARFPTVAALAAAPLDDVLSHWRGLGYYSRARNLHAAAARFAREGFPSTAAGLRDFPGIGRYTAAAVASIAFGDRAAVLDGNVARVLARLHGIEGPVNDRENEKRCWREAEALLDPARPGDFNQAMMELGATVCTPASPTCLLCPLQAGCVARRDGRQAELPAPKKRAARKPLTLACAVVRGRAGILLGRREGNGLFGGLWELPCVELRADDAAPDALRGLGFTRVSPESLATVRRTLTHRDLELRLFAASGRAPTGYTELRFASPEQARALGVSTAMAHALEQAFKAGRARARRRE